MATVEAVFEELNFPSAPRLKRVLAARGIPFNANEVDRLVRGETTRQVQAPTYKFEGKIASSDLNSRWFADLIDFTAAPSADTGKDVGLRPTASGEKYILVVQDVFSRFLYAEALLDKRPATVAAAFQKILDRAGVAPKSLMSDKGAEFGEPFQVVLAANDIMYTQKQKEDINAIATLDTAIGNLKKALARDARKQGTNNWASRLQKVTKGQNNLPNEDYLEGVAPNDVGKSRDLIDHLQMKNQEFTHHNQERADRRAAKLEEAGGFRAMESTGGKFTRGFKPRFEATVRQVGTVDGNEVTDESGNQFLTRFVQPVSEATADAGPVRIEQRGSAQTRARQTRILQPFADGLKQTLDILGSVSGQRALSILRGVSGQAAFRAAVAMARVNRSSLLKNVISLFPDMFKTEKRGNTLYVTSVAPASSSQGLRSTPPPSAPGPEVQGTQRLIVDDQGRLLLV